MSSDPRAARRATPDGPPARGRRQAAARPRRRLPRWLLWLLVVPGLLVAIALAGLLTVLFISLPLPTDPGGPAILLDATGTQFAQLTSEVTRRDVDVDTLPQHTLDAVVAAEDGDFYDHIGVDVASVGRAIVANLRSGEVSQGGSTITQQYIKVASGDDARTVWRKVTEAALALKLERTHTKEEILELYLNSVYFGRGAYGIQAAAQAYFAVDAGELTLPMSAVLAGVLPAPSVYDPLVDNRASHLRYRYVLEQMVANGMLAQADADALFAQQPPTVPRTIAARNTEPWFTDVVRRELEGLGYADGAGLTIHTSLDPVAQQHAQAAYDQAFPPTTATGALVALDSSTGAVIAIVGGEDYASDQLNTALAARQPGSTFKPLALAAWLEAGRSADDTFAAPGRITLTGADGGADWTVSNYAGADLGTTSLRQATWRSSNTAYAQLAVNLGPQALADLGGRLIGRPDAFRPLPSLVLGTQETTPLELASAYATLAGGGERHAPHAIREIRRGDEVLYTAPERGEQVLDPRTAHTVTDVLRGVVERGTGTGAAIGRPLAGKTGTTQDYGDAWFAGYTPQITAVVWMGNRDDRSPLPGEETGGGLPATTFARFMSAAHEGREVIDFPAVEGGPAPEDLVAPTETETATPTPTPTATGTPTPTASATPTPDEASEDDEPTPTPAPRPSPTPAPRPTAPPPPPPAPATEPPEPTEPPAPTSAPPEPTATQAAPAARPADAGADADG